MLSTVDPSDARPLYLQIMDEVRRGLVLGTVQEGEPLPSVRHLATELRINPNTVQQAYRELEREGLVYVQRGRGTFAAGLSNDEEERRRLAQDLAERTLHEAYRQGLTLEELLAALRRAAGRVSNLSEENR